MTVMSRLCLGILLALAALAARAESQEELCARARAAEARLDSAAALEAYVAADRLAPNQAAILQAIARQYSDLVVDAPTEAGKKQRAQRALAYAERAYALNPRDPVIVLSLAICHGTLAQYSDVATKVRYSRLVKSETEEALALDPDYAWAHHVLGRWHCEMAGLSRTGKFFVNLIYGRLPDASTRTGVAELERAVALAPHELSHQVELGFAYLADGQKTLAQARLRAALELPARAKHDRLEIDRARAALAKLEHP